MTCLCCGSTSLDADLVYFCSSTCADEYEPVCPIPSDPDSVVFDDGTELF
jgi:hypothetical protein